MQPSLFLICFGMLCPSYFQEIRIKAPKRFDKLIMLMCINKIGIVLIY